MLTGKGTYLWQVQNCENGDVRQIALLAQTADIRHVLVKVADGSNAFPGAAHEALTSDAISALRMAGVEVWGWGFVYGADPDGEANIAIQRINQLNLSGYAIDAEGAYVGRPVGTATRFMERLRAALPDLPLALSSFRFPSLQKGFPFDEFMSHCQIAMPQVYWVSQSGGDAAWDLKRSFQEYSDRWPSRTYIPTGAAYGEWQEGNWWWTARPHQVTTFLDTARTLGMACVNFWSWQHARFDLANPDYPGIQLWQAIADYPWSGTVPSAQPEIRPIEANIALKYRSQPEPDDAFWVNQVVFPQGTPFTALGYPTLPDEPGGYRWQRIRTAEGHEGWVAHSFGSTVYLTHRLEERPVVELPGEQYVWVIEPLGLKFRSRPIVNDAYWIDQVIFLQGTRLIAIGLPFLDGGGRYRWQMVRAPDGREGYVAYGYEHQIYLSDKKPVDADTPLLEVWTISDLNVRDTPGLDGSVIWVALNDTRLEVLEDPSVAAAKVGVQDAWLHVRTPSLKEGHVAAWYVTANKPKDRRRPVITPRVGESSYIYGIHDPFDRSMFGRRKGWVFVTEAVGRDPHSAAGNRDQYTEWSEHGFGVIVRLNHGYEGSGTIPDPEYYSGFAAACGMWVQRSIDLANPAQGSHVWVIGNEMNNPREWPGNVHGVGGRPITPEGYATCFNTVYPVIKSVQPDAIVCPGAVDPYYGPGSNNADWFREMLTRIDSLDGFVLHTYTHGPDPNLIVSRRCFGMDANGNWADPSNILNWQYFNFYAYRTYMDMISTKWRHLPVFITETDQNDPWMDVNDGWVQNAYAEIDRWNQQPHAQQIRALVLYRWSQADRWSIRDKPNVIGDLQAALEQRYRWRA